MVFPLPDTTTPSDENNYVVPDPNADTNILDLHSTVDDRPLTMQVGQCVFALGIDRTDLLKRLGLPIDPQDQAPSKLIVKQPPAPQHELRELGTIKYEEFSTGRSMQRIGLSL